MSTAISPFGDDQTDATLALSLDMMTAWVGGFTRLETLLDLVHRGQVRHIDIPLQVQAIRQSVKQELESVFDARVEDSAELRKFLKVMFD